VPPGAKTKLFFFGERFFVNFYPKILFRFFNKSRKIEGFLFFAEKIFANFYPKKC